MKTRMNFGIWAMVAFAGVGVIVGFTLRRWRCWSVMSCSLAVALIMTGCIPTALYVIAPAESPDGILIHTPEQLASAPMIRIKTDDPVEIRRFFYLAKYIVVEPWQMPLMALEETKNYCLHDWPKETGHQAGNPLGAAYGRGNWTGLCFTEAPYSVENAKKLCAVLNRPLLKNIPERRLVDCGARGGKGV